MPDPFILSQNQPATLPNEDNSFGVSVVNELRLYYCGVALVI